MEQKIRIAENTSKYPFTLFYQGNYQDLPTYNLIDIVEKNVSYTFKNSSLKKFVYLVVESLQNIERYSANLPSSKDFVFIHVSNSFFHFCSQNVIPHSKVEGLKHRLDEVSSKTQDELRTIYVQTAESDEYTEKGSGLGLIEMARKTNQSFNYSFDEMDKDYSFYRLNFAIPVDKKSEAHYSNWNESNEFLESLIKGFEKNNSTLYYGGDFSTKFILSLINLLNTVKNKDATSVSKKTHHILIELTQNIKKHALSLNEFVSGQMFVEWEQENMSLSTYNLIEDSKISSLEKRIAELNKLNYEELLELSKKQLQDLSIVDGLGLIDIALLTHPRKFEYLIQKKDTFVSELILSIKFKYE